MVGVETLTEGVNTYNNFVVAVFGAGVNTPGVNTTVQVLIQCSNTFQTYKLGSSAGRS